MCASLTRRLTPSQSLHPTQTATSLILVIDDDPDLLQILTCVIEDAGYRVITAPNGEQGVARYFTDSPDLALIDILMPVKDGIETILQIRRERPGAKLIAMSGGGRIDGLHYLGMAVRLGADVGLEKPFAIDKLLTALRRLLSPEPVVARAAGRFSRSASLQASAPFPTARRPSAAHPVR